VHFYKLLAYVIHRRYYSAIFTQRSVHGSSSRVSSHFTFLALSVHAYSVNTAILFMCSISLDTGAAPYRTAPYRTRYLNSEPERAFSIPPVVCRNQGSEVLWL